MTNLSLNSSFQTILDKTGLNKLEKGRSRLLGPVSSFLSV